MARLGGPAEKVFQIGSIGIRRTALTPTSSQVSQSPEAKPISVRRGCKLDPGNSVCIAEARYGETEPEDEGPAVHADDPEAPWPVRKGGVVLRLYSHSLSLTMFLLFVLSFGLHAAGSAAKASEEAAWHGGGPVGLVENLGNAEFWFESFQNW